VVAAQVQEKRERREKEDDVSKPWEAEIKLQHSLLGNIPGRRKEEQC